MILVFVEDAFTPVDDFLEFFRILTMQTRNKIAQHAQQMTIAPTTMKTIAIVSESDDVKFSVVAVSSSSAPILCAGEHVPFKHIFGDKQSAVEQHNSPVVLFTHSENEPIIRQSPERHVPGGANAHGTPARPRHVPFTQQENDGLQLPPHG